MINEIKHSLCGKWQMGFHRNYVSFKIFHLILSQRQFVQSFKIFRSTSQILYLVFVILVSSSIAQSTECRIDPLQMAKNPLVVNEDNQIIYPNSNTHYAGIYESQWLTVSCPGSRLYLDNGIFTTVRAQCVSDGIFQVNRRTVDFSELRCMETPKETVRYTGKLCEERGAEIEIGYSIDPHTFINQIKICFDTDKLVPIYSHHNVTSTIGYRDSSVARKFFEEDGFYTTSKTLDYLYNRNNERAAINKQLGLPPGSDKYIEPKGELFINRGHLSAKGDFVYDFEQLATFHYVNSAPQWASFNGGNWNDLEISVRDLADSRNTDLAIYTGVFDVTTLRHEPSRARTELYLHNYDNRYLLPVPRVFWKIIYDPKTFKGIAVVGVNNAYGVDLSESIICDDISDQITWFNDKLQSNKHDDELGYTYACTVDDLYRAITPDIPSLNVHTLLL